MKKAKSSLLRLVAQRAILTSHELPPLRRADLFEGAALLLPKKESEAAREIAFLLREAEHQQSSFAHLLFAENPLTQIATPKKGKSK